MGEPLPRRLRWRPGVHAVRRDAEHLQIGIDPPLRAVVRDTPAVRALLRDPSAGADAGPEGWSTLRTLRGAGLLLAGGEPDSGSLAGPAARRAAEAQFGEEAADRLAQRAEARVAVRAAAPVRTVLTTLLRAAGLGLARAEELPAVWLLVGSDEPPRGEIDPLVREGAPHLLVTCGATARVGPLVVPGRTACLRCVDAHLAEPDPRRPLVVEQAARAARSVDIPPVDPTLELLALAWAVRDLSRYAEGDQPSTWSATVELGPEGSAVRRVWERHPHCGCAWDLVL